MGMAGVNYVICVLLLLVLSAEVFLIIKRNRCIRVKGSDDFFSFSLVLLLAVLIFRLDESASMLDALRNTLVLLALLGTMGVKRGISEKGAVKLWYCIPWNEMDNILVEQHQVSKVVVTFTWKGRRSRLYFPAGRLKMVLGTLEKHVKRQDIIIEKRLENICL